MKLLKTIIPIAFGVLAVVAVLIFSFGNKGGGGKANNQLVMWGTLKAEGVLPILTALKDKGDGSIAYREIDRSVFERTLVEGLANGTGPDMILFPQDLLIPLQNKLFVADYKYYPQANYQSNFARAGEIFLTESGIQAFPFAIDPLVMYYNKDLFTNAGIASPPKFWREFFGMARQLVKTNSAGDISQSFVAFGTPGNITHSKEILAAMMMQTGAEIVKADSNGNLVPAISDTDGPETVLDFYTEFSNPRKNAYSWNIAEQESIDAFSAGDLALYFGPASDMARISAKNPYLVFGVTGLPQIENGSIRSTYGDLYAIGLLKNSPNLNLAYNTTLTLVGGDYPSNVPKTLGIAPARTDMLSIQLTDAVFPIVYDSAIKTRVWLDPAPGETEKIFDKMITLMTVDRKSSSDVIGEVNTLLAELIRSIK